MKREGFFAERIYPVLFMALVTIVCISLTSGIFLSTEDLVRSNETLFIRRAVLYSAGIPVPANSQEVMNLYSQRVEEVTDSDGELLFYRIQGEAGTSASFSIVHSGPGLWGEITAVLGFSGDLSSMTGLDFIKQNETPGLGARITEAWFKEQFRGKQGPFVMVPEGTARGSSEVDSITGATRTSDAVLALINGGIEKAEKIIALGGGI